MNGLVGEERLEGSKPALDCFRRPIHTQEDIPPTPIPWAVTRDTSRRDDRGTGLVSGETRREILIR